MQDLSQSKVASVITLAGGIWAAISPIWLYMTGGQAASAIATGSVIGILAIIQLAAKNPAPSWINVAAAIWLFISAFLFAASTAAVWSLIITAIVVFIVSIWDGAELAHFNEHRGQHHVGAV